MSWRCLTLTPEKRSHARRGGGEWGPVPLRPWGHQHPSPEKGRWFCAPGPEEPGLHGVCQCQPLCISEVMPPPQSNIHATHPEDTNCFRSIAWARLLWPLSLMQIRWQEMPVALLSGGWRLPSAAISCLKWAKFFPPCS